MSLTTDVAAIVAGVKTLTGLTTVDVIEHDDPDTVGHLVFARDRIFVIYGGLDLEPSGSVAQKTQTPVRATWLFSCVAASVSSEPGQAPRRAWALAEALRGIRAVTVGGKFLYLRSERLHAVESPNIATGGIVSYVCTYRTSPYYV